MPRIARTLTDHQARKIAAQGRHVAAPFLYLNVTPAGRYWEARYSDRRGKRVWRRIGDASAIPLAVARRKAEDMANGATTTERAGDTFAAVAERYLSANSAGWNPVHVRQWRQTLGDYILPSIGRLRVADITTMDVAEVLRPLWLTKPETARRIRSRIENVIDTAQAEAGVIALNPAAARLLRRILPKQESSDDHHEAPTVETLRDFLASLPPSRSASCIKFLALTASRTTEARQATWGEIAGNVWSIGAARMKASKPHRVPLSPAALAVLPDRGDPDDFVFGDLSLNAMRALLVKRGIAWTVHGIRSTFKDWAASKGYARELSELALAHTVGTKTERAYFRGDLLEQRRPMMDAWAVAIGQGGE